MNFCKERWFADRTEEVESWLREFIEIRKQGVHENKNLIEAMEYSLLSGGKRLRPLLVMAAAHAVDPSCISGKEKLHLLRDSCCAVEMVHNYSLIHDDLPAMDDDDLRRGKPTCHRVFGDAMAILAGDALLTDAFGVLAGSTFPDTPMNEESALARLRLCGRLAAAAGSMGMVSGQAMDISGEALGKKLKDVEEVHLLKTAALFSFSCAAGAESAGASSFIVEKLAEFGELTGIAFQIADDILDETGDPEKVGKRLRKDRGRNTATVTASIGLEEAGKRADQLVEDALSILEEFGEKSQPMRCLASRLIRRSS